MINLKGIALYHYNKLVKNTRKYKAKDYHPPPLNSKTSTEVLKKNNPI